MFNAEKSKAYEVLGHVENPDTGKIDVPLVGMKMMSDEDWIKSARENAVYNYTKKFGHPPDTVDIAVEWQREFCAEFIRTCEEKIA
jgi:hypothetical protein